MAARLCNIEDIIDEIQALAHRLKQQAKAQGSDPKTIRLLEEFEEFTSALLDLDNGTIGPQKLRYVGTRGQNSHYVFTKLHWEALFVKSPNDPVYRASTVYHVP